MRRSFSRTLNGSGGLDTSPMFVAATVRLLLGRRRRSSTRRRALIDPVAAERMEGRRVLVHATHTGTGDITGRMDDILTRHGFRVAVMKSEAAAPDKREAWVEDEVKQGIDVLIRHRRLVQTGLDLIDFQAVCRYEIDYSVRVMRRT